MPRSSLLQKLSLRSVTIEQFILGGLAFIIPVLLYIETYFDLASKSYTDFRLVLSLSAALLCTMSFFIPAVHRNLSQITVAILYAAVSHAIFLTYVNNFSYYYASLLMSIVIFSGFYFSSWRTLLVFQFAMFLILLQASALTTGPGFNISIFICFYSLMNAIVFLIQLYIFRKDAALRMLTHELENTADSLEKTNRSLEQFVYTASHDLKEPLRTVTSHLQLLKRNYGGKLDADADEYISLATGATKRMYALIDGLLKYSRAGEETMHLQKVDLNEVLENVLDNLGSSIKESEAHIEIAQMPVLQGDKMQLLQLFQNLISNAIKYRSFKTPDIRIVQEMKGNHCLISVEDNGLGIPDDKRDSVFSIFNRFHTEISDGVGIGLALCKKIVANHRGDIWVESEEGKGSKFWFTLQCATES